MGKANYEWIAAGEEWSEPWGGSAAQWFGSILPRIQVALPAETTLEIGSGFGRWSHYLRQHCQQLHLVDPDPQCMDACRRRFGADAGLSYDVNQNDSLVMVRDGSLDFVFSFDSLVHVRRQSIETYLRQLEGKLKPDGLAFIHHSNLGEYAGSLLRRARKRKTRAADHQRDPEMTANLFRELSERCGLKVVSQELVNWRGRRLIDCFSFLARKGSKWKEARRPFRNRDFMLEAQLLKRVAEHYPKLEER
jgi:2-polyprenyl-3-methyl-5-hydroxy-6-metoxy-1,4-benzoquinol methylase